MNDNWILDSQINHNFAVENKKLEILFVSYRNAWDEMLKMKVT